MIPSVETINSFTDREELAQALATRISLILGKAITTRNQAGLVVSGGSTPKRLFEVLSQRELDWSGVSISLADERWVAVSDGDSNENLIRKYLLQGHARKANFSGLKVGTGSAEENESACQQRLAVLPRPDLIVLGMGLDGHTASLFPGSAQLSAALEMDSGCLCKAITPPDSSHTRMTLTLPALLDAREIILHITGEDKLAVLKTALQEGSVAEMPVRAILKNITTPVSIFWSP